MKKEVIKMVQNNGDGKEEVCIICGKSYLNTGYGVLCDAIMMKPPCCSRPCVIEAEKRGTRR